MNPPADGGADRVNATLRRLPKVDDVLERPAVRGLLERAPRWAVVSAVRGEIERLRARLLERAPSESAEPQSPVELDERAVGARVEALLRPSLVRVLNATGVVLHTNLGRAPLAEAAVARVAEIARGYSNLEYKLDERRRGSRHDHVSGLLRELTGAEDALVVNNCAGAVLLALAATAQGRSAIVSRGELVEVGTTNRTHAKDYEAAIGDDTALLLKVHRSNFAVVGFTAEVSAGELAA